MLKQIAHIILSCWLAVLLLFGCTPKEFLHLFAAHEDTVHTHCANGELSFENEHHHCDFLSFSLTPFVQHTVSFFKVSEQKIFYEYSEARVLFIEKVSSEVITLRGPPAAC